MSLISDKSVTDWRVYEDKDTGQHYYSSKSKKKLLHEVRDKIPYGEQARWETLLKKLK